MTIEQVITNIGGMPAVRAYLRGVEEGSDIDKDASRALRAAISSMEAAGVYPVMSSVMPQLYAQCALLMVRMWTDAEDGASAAITLQIQSLMLQLRYHPENEET